MSSLSQIVMILSAWLVATVVVRPPTVCTALAFHPRYSRSSILHRRPISCYFAKDNDQQGEEKTKRSYWDILDDAVDDFLMKRMGNGEQWYGKRKVNPSGRFDGNYEGMGRSDHMKIEIARVQKEEMELKKQRRLAAEEEERQRRQNQT